MFHSTEEILARESLGLEPAARVVLALPPVTRDARTFESAWAFKLMQKIVPDARFILPRAGDDYFRIVRFFEDTRHLEVLCTPDEQVPLRTLLAACDLAVLLPVVGVPVDPLREAAAANVCVLTTERCARSAGVEISRGRTVGAPGSPREVAAVMLDLLNASGCADSGQRHS